MGEQAKLLSGEVASSRSVILRDSCSRQDRFGRRFSVYAALSLPVLVIALLGGTCGGPDLTTPIIDDTGEQVLDYEPDSPSINTDGTDPGTTSYADPGTTSPHLPQLLIEASANEGTVPVDVVFTAVASDGSVLPAGTYAWNFGDAHTAVGQQVTHTYNEPSVYTVSLLLTVVVDGAAYSTSATTAVSVSAPQAIEPAGIGAQYEVTEGEALQFVLEASATDGNTRFTIVTTPTAGTLDVPSGVGLDSPIVTYTAPADFSGEVSFTFAPYDITRVTPQAIVPAQVATVRVKVLRKGILSVSPTGGLSATGNVGGPFAPSSATYTLTNTGARSIGWSASKTQNWTALSSASGTLAPGDSTPVTVSINSAANTLAAGSYSDLVTFTNTSNGAGDTAVAISLNVIAPAGVLSVTPASGATATGNQGGPFTPSSLVYTVANTGQQSINWTAAKTQAWVTLSKNSGTLAGGAFDTVTVSINSTANSVAAGGYSDTITFTNTTNGSGSTTRSVGLTVVAVPGMLSVSPTSGFNSSGYRGGPFTPASATYTLTNTGGQPFNWTAAKNQSWVTLSKAAGTLAAGASDTLIVSVNSAANSLAAGTYADTLTFTNTTTGSGNTTRGFSLTVNATQGALSVSATGGLTSTGTVGGPFAPSSVTYTLTNTGGQSFNWVVSKAQSWVTLSKLSGTLAAGASDTLAVSINSAANSLAVGNYSDTVIFSNTTSGSGNTTRSVSLAITAVPGALSVSSAAGLTTVGNQGGTFAPGSVVYTLSNTGGQPFNWTAAKTQNWVTLSKASGTLAVGATDSVSVALNTAANSLVGGTYTDTVTFTNATSGSGNTTRSVTLHVVPALTIGVSTGGGDVPLNVQYSALDGGVTASHLPTGSTLNWNFGDATPMASGAQTSHTFTTAGTYLITLSLILPSGLGTVACAQTTTQATQPGSPDGPVISGQLTLLPTLGYRPPLGQQDILFTGSGASTGVNYTATTDVQGNYTRTVPTGWTGTITPATNRMIFLDPTTRSSYKTDGSLYSVAITSPLQAPATKNITVWTAPIGVPAPSFGIMESHWMYVGKTYDFGSGPVAYPDAGNGPYTHYVDNANANATDSNNPYGSPSKPRRTIPSGTALPAGSIVEVHGTYPSAQLQFIGAGTAAAPVFLRGPAFNDRPSSLAQIIVKGSYVIVENLYMAAGAVEMRPHNSSSLHHACVRFCEGAGDGTKTGPRVSFGAYGASGNVFSHLVIYNNHLHDVGDISPTAGEDDWHGITVNSYAEDVWTLDNHIARVNGDSIQVNAGSSFSISRVYIGRNLFHDNHENSVDIKQANDVIVSQNEMYGARPCATDPGGVVAVHYDPKRVWLINNYIHDGQYAITSSGAAGLYIIGNLVADIRQIDIRTHDVQSIWRGGIGVRVYSSTDVNISGNTIYDCVTGIGLDCGSNAVTIQNNIISNLIAAEQGCELTIWGTGRNLATITNNLMFEPGGALRLCWGGTFYSTVASFAATDKGANSIQENPLFVNAAQGNFGLQAGSPALDTGVTPDVCQTFQNAYGLSIAADISGALRPKGAACDIGAHER